MNQLEVQKYLRVGREATQLNEDFGIRVYEHPSLPLVGLKYSQIHSPRAHPIVRECRGLVLEKDTWNIVAKSFDRFFNVGETVEGEKNDFEWQDFEVFSKEDGSLIIVYWYKGEWHANTSGSFGLGPIEGFGGSWRDLFWFTAPFSTEDLDALANQNRTYVFELCTPYNKVVRRYRPSVYLLGAFDLQGADRWAQEVPQHTCDQIAETIQCKRPNTFKFSSQNEVKKFLLEMEEKDSTFEGVVLRDYNGLRYKWKTSTYLALHRIKDNGNVLLPKNLVPIVLANEHHEIVAVMPECKSAFMETVEILEATWLDLLGLWGRAKDLTEQKTYALMVKDHLGASLLFKARKQGIKTEAALQKLWRESGDMIVKRFFNNRTFKFDILKD